MSNRETMISELKRVVQPHLRAREFSGSFPHFRKIGRETTDLLTFQFDQNGGGFVIEIARCPSKGIVTHSGKHIPPNKVRAWDVHPLYRKRIGPRTDSGTDSWFRFDAVAPPNLAEDVLEQLLDPDLWSAVELQPEGPIYNVNSLLSPDSGEGF